MAKSASVRERLSLTSTSHQSSGVMQPEAQSMSRNFTRSSGGRLPKLARIAASIVSVLASISAQIACISSSEYDWRVCQGSCDSTRLAHLPRMHDWAEAASAAQTTAKSGIKSYTIKPISKMMSEQPETSMQSFVRIKWPVLPLRMGGQAAPGLQPR